MAAQHHGIGTTIPGPDGKYSTDQIHAFQSEDRSAAKAVIWLMTAVFMYGLCYMMVVCWFCLNT